MTEPLFRLAESTACIHVRGFFIKVCCITEAAFNLHAWVYVCEDVRIHRSLDVFSAFSFESQT